MSKLLEKQYPLVGEKVEYRGKIGFMNDFMTREQLYDEELWKIFADQFRERKDGSRGEWRGEFFGKMMRGACLTYKYTRDEKLYGILETAIKDFLTARDEYGRFSTYTLETEFTGWDMWGRKYALLGLLYFYEICKDERLKAEVLSAAEKHADYITAHVGKGKKHPVAYAKLLFWHHAGLPSCSVLEAFARLYKIAPKPNYLDYANQIIEAGFTNNDDNLVDIFYKNEKKISELISKKAYEMMSCFNGLIEYYEIVGEEKYLIAARNFVNAVIDTELTEIGALGTDFEFFDSSVENQTYYKSKPMLETCVTVTFMNLCYKMLQFTGESRFADYIERSAYNAMLGALNTEKNETVYKRVGEESQIIETKRFIPIDSYSPIVKQRRAIDFAGCLQLKDDGTKYGCCVCIASMGTAISALFGIMRGENGYVINGYEEGRAELISPSGKTFCAEFSGKPFENDESVKIKLSMSGKETLRFALRIPEWSPQTTVKYKGETVMADCGYFEIVEEFRDGDIIELMFDTRIKAVKRNGKTLLKKCMFALARDERYADGFDDDVSVTVEKDGFVKGEKITSGTVNAIAEFSVPLADGKKITVCDYSSAGKVWDGESNIRISAWL